MFNQDLSKYTIELLKRDIDDIRNYSIMFLELVKESDQRTVEEEMDRIRSQYHIDHCWIKTNEKLVGVVKIIRNTFYSLGLIEEIPDRDILEIIDVIERDILSFHMFKIECTVRDRYLDAVLHSGYTAEYSRNKMGLDLDKVKINFDGSQLNIKPFKNRYLKDLTLLFIDAYRDGVDERIGMFNEGIAHSAMNSIVKGNFGKMLPDLSGIIFEENEIVAGVLVTLLENSPFIVIIGVKRKFQGKNYGKTLMDYVIRRSKEEGFSDLKLWVTVENKVALGLYRSLGFKEILSIHSLVKIFQ